MLQIYNTLTQKKEVFTPMEEGKVKMYVCGLTTYDYCHIGHARMLVAFDVIVRYLRAKKFDVTYVRNITDIDDKIVNRAKENNEDITALTERFIQAMHEDEATLGVLPPDMEPRATANIEEIQTMIQQLIDKGCAYAADNGDVYFAINSFANYAQLSKKNLQDLLSGVRIEVEDAKRDARDFALWKAAEKDDVGWESPWGFGRPGWHIECSAMSTNCLGQPFDIHGGGSDLMFPHHDNEIAQSEAASGKKFVHTWMHNGAVRVDNEKMSKSLDNFFTIREVLKKYSPEVLRYLLISSHYRSAINYSEEALQQAANSLEGFYTALRGCALENVPAMSDSDYEVDFFKAMDDDFNTAEALSTLFDLRREINRLKQAKGNQDAETLGLAALLKQLASVLGVLQLQPETFLQQNVGQEVDADYINQLITQRKQARENKDWALADKIRDELTDLGVVLEDGAGATRWRIER